MYEDKKIGVVFPANNEETQISDIINSLPSFIDKIVVFDDKSTDNTFMFINNFCILLQI